MSSLPLHSCYEVWACRSLTVLSGSLGSGQACCLSGTSRIMKLPPQGDTEDIILCASCKRCMFFMGWHFILFWWKLYSCVYFLVMCFLFIRVFVGHLLWLWLRCKYLNNCGMAYKYLNTKCITVFKKCIIICASRISLSLWVSALVYLTKYPLSIKVVALLIHRCLIWIDFCCSWLSPVSPL